jgi:hypothetical protein
MRVGKNLEEWARHAKTCLAKPFSLVEFRGAVGKLSDKK